MATCGGVVLGERNNRSRQMSLQGIMFLAAMMGMGPYTPPRSKYSQMELEHLLAEYTLIKQKKSKLSRSERDKIVAYVERLIAEAENEV